MYHILFITVSPSKMHSNKINEKNTAFIYRNQAYILTPTSLLLWNTVGASVSGQLHTSAPRARAASGRTSFSAWQADILRLQPEKPDMALRPATANTAPRRSLCHSIVLILK